MTEEIICRYKFQNNEKFNGKEYCTLFNEVCSDVEFVCDKNCQVYEDYKQLKRLEQKRDELKKAYDEISNNSEMREWREQSLNYRSALEEIQKAIKSYDLIVDNGASVDTLYTIRKIINEVL